MYTLQVSVIRHPPTENKKQQLHQQEELGDRYFASLNGILFTKRSLKF